MLNLGKQPPANSLYRPNEKPPASIPLRLMYCQKCSTVQLGESVDPEYLFDNYLWVTATSDVAKSHSVYFAKNALKKCPVEKPNIIEIASNDGTFLKEFIKKGCDVLGIDPATNIAKIAKKNGIPTLATFFGKETAQEIVNKQGRADIVFARNVIPHVKKIHSVIEGIQMLLKDSSIGIIEFHDARLILEELHYDSIYHEHLFYFSLKTISTLLAQYNLYVFDIIPSPISGGSWIIYFSKTNRVPTKEVKKIQALEITSGINTYRQWRVFAKQVSEHANTLKSMVKNSSVKIMAYGASARSSTLLNFCQINTDKVLAIIDKNPLKQGLITPGTNIPIMTYQKSITQIKSVDTILLLAWNFKDEIIHDLRSAGFTGKFIIPLPNQPYIV